MSTHLPASWRTHPPHPHPFIDTTPYPHLRHHFPTSLSSLKAWTTYHPTNNLTPHLPARGTDDLIIWYVYRSDDSYLFGPSACEPHYMLDALGDGLSWHLRGGEGGDAGVVVERGFMEARERAERGRWPRGLLAVPGGKREAVSAAAVGSATRVYFVGETGVYSFWYSGSYWRVYGLWRTWREMEGLVVRLVGPAAGRRDWGRGEGFWASVDLVEGVAWVVDGCERGLVEAWFAVVGAVLAVEGRVRAVQRRPGVGKVVRRFLVEPVMEVVQTGVCGRAQAEEEEKEEV